MNTQLQALAATTTLLLVTSFGMQSKDADLKPAYIRTGQEITLTGSIDFTGRVPAPRTIDTSADPVCTEASPNLATDWLIVNDGRVENVVVYVTNSSILDTYSWKPPDSTVELEHTGCRYRPHVLALQVGQKLNIVNSDGTHHNTHPTPRLNKEWNQTQPPGAPPITNTFVHPEVAIPFKDNQHPWEKAYVAVFKHPYFAITDANGNFRIEGLPPGQYDLVAWHEEMGQKKMELTVAPGEPRTVAFSFDQSDLKGSRLMQKWHH